MSGKAYGVMVLGVLLLCCRAERKEVGMPVLEWKLQTTDTGVRLSLWAGAHREAERQALRSVQRIHVALRSPEGELLGEATLVPNVGGMAHESGEASLVLQGEALLQRAPATIPARVLLDYELESSSRVVRQKRWVQRWHIDGALELAPELEVDSQGVLFRVRARRLRPVEGEYFPSSERLRVELFAGGKRLWGSQDGVAFLQVIGAVEPTEVGAEHVYEYRWHGRLGTGQRPSPGVYEVHLSLPVRPRSYSVVVPLQWHSKP